MVKKIFALLVIAAVSAFSQNVKVKAFTDSTDYNVGDYINYTVSVEHNKNIAVAKPVLKDSTFKLDVIGVTPVSEKEEGDKVVTEFKYVLSGYDSMNTVIPGFAIRYKQGAEGEKLSDKASLDTTLAVIYTPAVNVKIHTLQVDTQKDIKDIKDRVTIPLDWKIVLLWMVIAAALIYAAYYLWMKYRRSKQKAVPEPKKIVIPADIEAFAALDNLEKKQLWQKGMVKEYHSEITEIIRLYFEKRFSLPALELTTSEVNAQLRRKTGAADIIELTNDFLSNADLVKFAKYQPAFNVNEEMMRQAKEIVERTRPGKAVEGHNVR